MPATPSFPGIYIQELASSVHTVTAAPTNVAVFIGYTHPLKTVTKNFKTAYQISGFQDYQRQFGGFLRSAAFASAIDPSVADPSTSFGDMAQAVNQFFLNGGTQAYVVALESQFLSSLVTQPDADPTIPTGAVSGAKSTSSAPLTFWAREITDATYQLTVQVVPANPPATSPPPPPTADIVITYGPVQPPNSSGPVSGTVIETYRQVNLVPGDPNYVTNRINSVSGLVWVTVASGSPPTGFTAGSETLPAWLAAADWASIAAPTDFTGQMQQDTDLDKVSVFNLMVIPGVTNDFVLSTALAFCERKRAFCVMDPPLNASADGTDPKFPTTIQVRGAEPADQRERGAVFPLSQVAEPADRPVDPSDHRAGVRGSAGGDGGGHLCRHRSEPRRVEGAGRLPGHHHKHHRRGEPRPHDRSAPGRAQPARHQLPARLPEYRHRRVRRADHRDPDPGTMALRLGPANGAVSRTDLLREPGMGRVRAERAAAVVGDHDEPQLVHARACSARAHSRAPRPARRSACCATARPRRRTISTTASSTSSSPSRR